MAKQLSDRPMTVEEASTLILEQMSADDRDSVWRTKRAYLIFLHYVWCTVSATPLACGKTTRHFWNQVDVPTSTTAR